MKNLAQELKGCIRRGRLVLSDHHKLHPNDQLVNFAAGVVASYDQLFVTKVGGVDHVVPEKDIYREGKFIFTDNVDIDYAIDNWQLLSTTENELENDSIKMFSPDFEIKRGTPFKEIKEEINGLEFVIHDDMWSYVTRLYRELNKGSDSLDKLFKFLKLLDIKIDISLNIPNSVTSKKIRHRRDSLNSVKFGN